MLVSTAAPIAPPAPSQPATGGSWNQSASGLFVPGGSQAGTTTASGLFVPGVEVPTAGSITVARPEDVERATSIVREQRDVLAGQYGVGAADALLGSQVEIADTVRSEIEHDRIVDAFLHGGVTQAARAAAQVQPTAA